MAHSSAKSLPELPGFPQSQTLYISAPGKVGLLLTPRGLGYRTREMKFADAHAALTWCETHGANMMFTSAPDPAAN